MCGYESREGNRGARHTTRESNVRERDVWGSNGASQVRLSSNVQVFDGSLL